MGKQYNGREKRKKAKLQIKRKKKLIQKKITQKKG